MSIWKVGCFFFVWDGEGGAVFWLGFFGFSGFFFYILINDIQ